MNRTVRIGTRGSALALAQSRWVRSWLQRQRPDVETELVPITTSGDRLVDQPLSVIGGKGVFVKEIEEALLAETIDCAVHSMKDVPSELVPGLMIAATPAREDPRDVLIAHDRSSLRTLRPGARVGTSSLRRMALLRAFRSDIDVTNLRGNVDTRLRRLDAGTFDAIVLAAAGLYRLGIARPDVEFLDSERFIPAIGQGVLAVESRCDHIADLLAPLDHRDTRIAVTAERAFLLRVGGSCRTPLAAYARVSGDAIDLRAFIGSPDGTRLLHTDRAGTVAHAADLGIEAADELLERGGADILRALTEAADDVR